MSDSKLVARNLAKLGEGDVIDDATARVIASWWHGGQWSPLYSLSSCGAIDDRTVGEIKSDLASRIMDRSESLPLRALLAYVEKHGTRGRVAGWSDLWVS